MLKKLFIIFLSTFLFVTVVEAKKAEKKEPVKKEDVYHAVWKKTYGGDDGDMAHGIVALGNGDSVLVGTCKSF